MNRAVCTQESADVIIFKRTVLLGTCLLLGVSSGLYLVQTVDGEHRPKAVERNFRHYEQHVRDINVVFIGSSRLGRNINPDVFDATMGAHGIHTVSFVFWLGNMHAPEARRVIREILYEEPYPDLLIVESLRADGKTRGDLTDRALWWRGIEELPFLFDDLHRNQDWNVRAEHVKLTLVHWFRIGKGIQIATQKLRSSPAAVDVQGMGHDPFLTKRKDNIDPQRMVGVESIDNAQSYQEFHRQVRDIVAGRAQVLLLLPVGSLLSPHALAESPDLLCMNRPDRYPDIYHPDKWADNVHLLDHGAREYSALLADEIAGRAYSFERPRHQPVQKKHPTR